MTSLNRVLSSQHALWFRLAVGAVFGLLIAFLAQFDEPSSRVHWRETLAGTLALIAFVLWAGAGAMRRISLMIWTGIASAFVFYILWTGYDGDNGARSLAFEQTLLIFPLLFIAHELVSSGDQAGKRIAPYETYFDEAWKRGVQLALAILFTLLFWGILWLGSALLGFIGFTWLELLFESEYFSWPATGLAFGAAVHLGDVQTKLLSNVRTLILGVLSWLLPVITLIGAIFAASLLVSGLAPLWATKAATATLLGGCVGFALLINAAYQQGDVERPVPVVLKWCVRVATILLLIFAVLAAWSLGLRINQYGLSPDRVYAGLGVIIALAYGVGYAVAVFVPGRWMATVEGLNIYFAIFICALFVAVLTPIASPDRLSVADQVARLKSGKVSVADFDWWLLKDDTGVYGKKALTALSTSGNAAIATKAKAAVDNKIGNRPYRDVEESTVPAATRADIAALPIVFPSGGKLPESFLAIDFTNTNALTAGWTACLTTKLTSANTERGCKIALIDLDRNGREEVLIREYNELIVYSQQNGTWKIMGSFGLGATKVDFDNGKLRAAPSSWDDLLVGERRHSLATYMDPAEAAKQAVEDAAKPSAGSAGVVESKAPPPPSK
jgi:hypothetical protein